MATGLQWSYDPNVNVMTGGGWSGWLATTFDSLMNNADFRMSLCRSCAEVPLQRRRADDRRRAGPLPGDWPTKSRTAMVTESARWGDVSGTLYTPSDWSNDRDYVLNTWLAAADEHRDPAVAERRAVSKRQRARLTASTARRRYGGVFNPGDTLTITASASPIYYTLDGSDPRLPGGGAESERHALHRSDHAHPRRRGQGPRLLPAGPGARWPTPVST